MNLKNIVLKVKKSKKSKKSTNYEYHLCEVLDQKKKTNCDNINQQSSSLGWDGEELLIGKGNCQQ